MKRVGVILEQLGSGLRDLAIVGMGIQFNGTGNIAQMNFYLILAGSILSLAGKSITAAFQDTEVKKAISSQNDKIDKLASDTAQFTK